MTRGRMDPQVLRQYALLGDGERGALIGPHGDLAWLCAPSWHSDAVFSSLIGGEGTYVVTPADDWHVWGGYYEPRGLIWRSRWITADGIIECREALAFPGDPECAVLLRRIVAVRGDARVQVILEPRAGFGHHPCDSLVCPAGIWTGRSGPLRWRWAGAPDARVRSRRDRSDALAMELVVPQGSHHDLVLQVTQQALPGPIDPTETWAATEAAWAAACPDLEGTIAPRDARHAWVVLRGLTSSTGGMVAAATTSLPERAGGSRNYDYRYAWIRDQSYAGMAEAAAGEYGLLDSAVEFVAGRVLADGPRLRPAYLITGESVPSERTLELAGYPGGVDTVGNWVNQHFQLDLFGEVLQLLALAARLDRLDADGWRAVRSLST